MPNRLAVFIYDLLMERHVSPFTLEEWLLDHDASTPTHTELLKYAEGVAQRIVGDD